MAESMNNSTDGATAPNLRDDILEWQGSIDYNQEGLKKGGVHGPTTDLGVSKVQRPEDLQRDWDILMQPLITEDKTLLDLLAFFDPDAIPQSLLLNNRAHITEPNLQFLTDFHE